MIDKFGTFQINGHTNRILPLNHPRHTIIDIAKAANVSKSTVSLVLQGSPLVNKTTREHVNKVIAEHGYIYNRAAAGLRFSTSKIIGVVVNDLTNPFFAELAVGIDAEAQEAGFVQFMAHTAENTDRQKHVIASMRENGICGLIVCPARGSTAQDFEPLLKNNIPVVLAVRTIPDAGISHVISDNHAGVFDATRHLHDLGHRRIAFLGGFADTRVFAERLAGYRDALFGAMITLDAKLVTASMPSRAGGVSAMERVLSLPNPPTAAVCLNDAVAFGACDALRAAGKTPGRDFAIVGFDDVIEAKSVVPALTTVTTEPQNIGRRAARLLMQQIASGIIAEQITMPVRLTIRRSCGAR